MNIDKIDFDKTLRVSHCDMDGIMPLILDAFFGLNFGKSISTNYGEDLELDCIQLGDYNTVIYTDFTPSETVRKIITEKQIHTVIFDHHIAVKDEIELWMKEYSDVEYVFDNERCGTKIYYDCLMESGLKEKTNKVAEHIVRLTDVYDLYKQDSDLWNDAFKLNTLMYCTGRYWEKDDRFKCFQFFINNVLWKMQNSDHFFFNSLEESKINADIVKANRLFEDLVKNASKEISTRKDSRGFYFAVFHCNSKVSDVCNKILRKYKKLSYVLCINDYDKENPKISLRSVDEFDLTELNYAKGHANASGVSPSEVDDMKEFVKKIESKEIYELGYRGDLICRK